MASEVGPYVLRRLDHVNVQVEAARYPAALQFYTAILGLREGPRPSFNVAGAWLYPPPAPGVAVGCEGQQAIVHLVVRPDRPFLQPPRDPRLPLMQRSEDLRPGEAAAVRDVPRVDHFAVFATGMSEFLARCRAASVGYEIKIVPVTGMRQVNVRDPDGNLIEVQFAAAEPLPALLAFRNVFSAKL